jgi:hypothetical protein
MGGFTSYAPAGAVSQYLFKNERLKNHSTTPILWIGKRTIRGKDEN